MHASSFLKASSWLRVGSLAGLFLACGGPAEVPADLIGRWETESAAYEGRYFEVTENHTLILNVGDNTLRFHPIRQIRIQPQDDGRTGYRLDYDGEEGVPLEMRLQLRPGTPDRIQIENRDELWTRVDDRSDVGRNFWQP